MRFVLLTPLIFLLLNEIEIVITDTLQYPLWISVNSLELELGKNSTIYIKPTEYFNLYNESFFNDSTLTLNFNLSNPSVIHPISPITLYTNEKGVFDNASIDIITKKMGRTTLSSYLDPEVQNFTTLNIFLNVSIYKWPILNWISIIVGWLYFAAWSISFYPQIYQNWQRKSVRGLSLDFVYLNITGHALYGLYNIGLYWVKDIQDQYLIKYPDSLIPVKLNDVIFSIHATLACALTVFQCTIYEKGTQTISKAGKSTLFFILSFIFVIFIVSVSNAITWLEFFTICSFVKLVITLIKYVPQAWLNFSRKSTSGWCIGNVLLDFTGGIFSILQMFLIAYNNSDWISIFGDFTKFGLGLFSVGFDIFFILQHYIFYRKSQGYDPIEGNTNPTIQPQEDLVTSTNQVVDASNSD